MEIATSPEWQQLAVYAVGAALVLLVLFNIPYVGRLFRALFSLALLALMLFMLFQQAPYEPALARFTDRLGLNTQEIAGGEVRIRMSPDGHFWAQADINGIKQRMLVDSGATVTALSARTADRASIDHSAGMAPIILRTANGAVRADAGTIDVLRVGEIEARNLNIVVSPALGNVDVIGMNFLSALESWRVEGRTLILVPRTN